MKTLIDIHVVLATPADIEYGKIRRNNSRSTQRLLFMLYDRAEDDTPTERLENQIQKVWEVWHEDEHLLDIDPQDLSD